MKTYLWRDIKDKRGSSRPASASVTWDGWHPPPPLDAGVDPVALFAPLVHWPTPADVDCTGLGPRDIPWLASRALYPQLYALGRLLRPGRLLEIGTLYGHGACAFVAGAGGYCHTVHVIDAELYFGGGYLGHAAENIRAMLAHVAPQRRPPAPPGHVTVWPWNTDQGLPFTDETFDLVIVDGDHTYEGKRRDLTLAWDVLVPGGHLYVDDIHSMPAVHRAVADFAPTVTVASVLELLTRTTDRPRGAYLIEKGEA